MEQLQNKTELLDKCKSVEIGKIDFVIVTGDFHDFNDKKDFGNAINFLRELTSELGLDVSRDLFLIPGNHDGVSEIEYRDEMLISAKAKPLEIGKRVDKLLKMFEDYELFVKELIPDYPIEHPASIHIRNWNEQISFIHCNTAIGADGETKENQVLDIDGLSALNVNGECPTVILAHNSFFDLHELQQSRVKDFICNNNIRAYLCGDRHKEKVEQITYRDNQNKQIPCIVSYKSAPDPRDEYSTFGVIVGTWQNEKATLEGWKWMSGKGFKVDPIICEQEIYMGCSPEEKICDAKNSSPYQLLAKYGGWKQIDNGDKSKNIALIMKRFLQGHPCTWALAFSGLLVERQQLGDIVKLAETGGIYALLGAGAEGKSTLLKQACVQLYNAGHTVLFHNRGENYILPSELPEGTILVVDEPDDTGFQNLIEFALNSEIPLIFAFRRNEWNLFCKRNRISSETKRAVIEIEVQNITDEKEAAAFADCVIKYCRPDAEREKLVKIFLRNGDDNGYLYAAMLMSIHDKEKLEEIAADIIDNIRTENDRVLKLLAYAVLHEHVGVVLDEQEYTDFVAKLELRPRVAKETLELELCHSRNHWQTQHPQISGLFYKYCFEEGGEYDIRETDSMRLEILNSLLKKYNSINYGEKEYVLDDIFHVSQLINEACEVHIMLERIIEEFCLDVKNLQRINSRLIGDKNREMFGRMCYIHEIYNGQLMLSWAKATKSMNGAGGYEKENSALWICKTACIERKMSDSSVWLGWAGLEKETNGAGRYEKENSALWIYRMACVEGKVSGPDIWLGWAELENETNGAGRYEKENSALWIYRMACIERKMLGSSVWLGWAGLEKETNGAGRYEKENSALWIYRMACVEGKVSGSNIWLGWAELEKETNGAGRYEKENSALWIYRMACIERKVSGSDIWLGWAECVRNNAFCSQDWTADKIYQRALEVTKDEDIVMGSYAKFLMYEGRFEESRSVFRNLYLKGNKYYLSSLLFIEMIVGNNDSNSEFCVEKLVCIIEESVTYSFSAQYALYVYYCSQKNDILSHKYYDMLDLSKDNIVHHVERTEHFFEICQKAYERLG